MDDWLPISQKESFLQEGQYYLISDGSKVSVGRYEAAYRDASFSYPECWYDECDILERDERNGGSVVTHYCPLPAAPSINELPQYIYNIYERYR